MHFLMKMPDKPIDTKVIQSLMARVKTEEARKGIQLADRLSDMILFHTRVLENFKKLEQPWIVILLYSVFIMENSEASSTSVGRH